MSMIEAVRIETSAGSTTIAVAGTATVYTKAIEITEGEYFALSAKATLAVGSVNVQIDIEQSFQKPYVEGSACDRYAIPENTSAILTLTGTTIKHIVCNPTPLKYIRYKLTGLAGNDNATTVQLWHSQRESGR